MQPGLRPRWNSSTCPAYTTHNKETAVSSRSFPPHFFNPEVNTPQLQDGWYADTGPGLASTAVVGTGIPLQAKGKGEPSKLT